MILDGGTKLSDEDRKVWVTDADGAVVSEGLHEYMPGFFEDAYLPISRRVVLY